MIERTLFTPDHEVVRDRFRCFLEKEVAPFHADWEAPCFLDCAGLTGIGFGLHSDIAAPYLRYCSAHAIMKDIITRALGLGATSIT